MNTGLRRLYGSIRGGNWEQALELFPLVVFDFSRQQQPSSSSSSSSSSLSTSSTIASSPDHERTGSVLSELMKLCRANGRNREAVQVFSAALETGLHCCSEADREGMESLQELRNAKESIHQVREQLRLSQQQQGLSSLSTSMLASTKGRGNDVALYDNSSAATRAGNSSSSGRLQRHTPTPSLVLTRSVSGGDESAWSQSLRLLFLLRASSTPGKDSPALRVAVPPPNGTSSQHNGRGVSSEEEADAYCQAVATRILEASTAKEKIDIVTMELSEICHGGGIGSMITQPDGKDGAHTLTPAYTLDFVRCLAAVALDHAVAYAHDEGGGCSTQDDEGTTAPPSCLLDAATSGNLAAFDNVFFTLVAKWGRKYTFTTLDTSTNNNKNGMSYRGGTLTRGGQYGGSSGGVSKTHRPSSSGKSHILVPKEGSDGVVYAPSIAAATSPSASYLPPHLTAEERMEYLFGSLSASHSSRPPHTRTFVILDVDYILSQKFVKLIAEMAMSTSTYSDNGITAAQPRNIKDCRSVPDVWSSSMYHNAELVVTFSTLMALLECAMTSPLAKERLEHLLAARTSYSPRSGDVGGAASLDNNIDDYAVVRRRFGSLVSMLPEDLQADLFGTGSSQPRRTTPQPRTSPRGGVTILGLQEEIMLTQITMGEDVDSGAAPPSSSTNEQNALADVQQRTQRLVAVARVISNIVEEASSTRTHGRVPTKSATPPTGGAVDAILRSIGLGHLSDDNATGDVFLEDTGGDGGDRTVVDTSREKCNVLVGAIAGGAVARACQTKGVQIL